MSKLNLLNDMNDIIHKDSINDDNDSNIINNNISNREENFNADINQYKSQEKIIHFEKGSKVCCKRCSILAISLILTLTASLVGFIRFKSLWTFAFAGPFALVFLYELGFFIFCCCGFRIVQPNNALVFEFFGRYIGTLKDNGFWYGYPYASAKSVSLRSIQYNGNRVKVNERDGNPVELGIIVIWKIGDTAKATFDVVDYNQFVETQSEAAIRYIGCKYPYDPIKPGEISLRGGHEVINRELKDELEKRVTPAGIIIEDARVTEISYGQEVAQMMLQKQASTAAATAKETIVKSATNSIIQSLNEFEKYGCRLKEEDKAKYMISMMNTLCMSSEISKIMPNNQ